MISEWEEKHESVIDALDKIERYELIASIHDDLGYDKLAKMFRETRIKCIEFYENKTNKKYVP